MAAIVWSEQPTVIDFQHADFDLRNVDRALKATIHLSVDVNAYMRRTKEGPYMLRNR